MFPVCSPKGDTGGDNRWLGKTSIARRGFGRIERRESGRYQAAYTGPDGRLYRAPTTFDARDDAVAWISARRAETHMEVWAPDAAIRGASQRAVPTMKAYGDQCLRGARPAAATCARPPASSTGCCSTPASVAIPPHLIPVVRAHLKNNAGKGKDALLFPAAAYSNAHMAPSTLYKGHYPARRAAGRDDLRWHDLRHTGAVLAAQTGATLAELMGRLGYSTPGAAMRYQHAAADREAEIARRLSALVEVSDPTGRVGS